ncbi:hypothetical protein AB4Y94_17770, partial [Glaciibacter sp. 2TAF33]
MTATAAPTEPVPTAPGRERAPRPPRHGRARRLARRTGIAALVALALILGSALTNAVLNQVERSSTSAYGERVSVTGGTLNVYRHGDTGPTIVMLGGYGTASPALDFAPLIRELDG